MTAILTFFEKYRPTLGLCASVAIVLAFYALALVRFSHAQFGGNITGFSYISKNWSAQPLWKEKTFLRDDDGYDGQFYYYVAHDPFIRTRIYTYFLDNWTSYRYKRVGYPLLVWLFALGQAGFLSFMMIAVNFLAVGIGCWFVGLIAQHYGRSTLWCVLYGLIPGLFLAVTRNLTEPLQMACLVAGLYFYVCKKKPAAASFFWAYAALCKDTALLVPLTFFLKEIIQRNYKRSAYCLIPFALYAVWTAYVSSVIRSPMIPTTNFVNFNGYNSLYPAPFLPLIQSVMFKWKDSGGFQTTGHYAVEFFLTLSCASAIFLSWIGVRNKTDAISLPLLSFGLFSMFIANPWIEYFGYTRTIAPLFLFLLAHFFATKDKWALVPMIPGAYGLFVFLKASAVIR
jgi:hypothetical protein